MSRLRFFILPAEMNGMLRKIECPHRKQMALSRGLIGTQGDEPKIACPFHKKTFSLETGECLSGDECSIRTYPVKVENGKVYIKVEEE